MTLPAGSATMSVTEAGPWSRSPADRALMALVRAQSLPLIGTVVRQWLKLHGTDIPPWTIEGSRGLILQHGGQVVVHWSARIGNNVVLMQNCTIGRGDIWRQPDPDLEGFDVGDDVIICAGAVVLCSHGTLRIGRGTVVGANAVLTQSTGENEVWAGVPARRVGFRVERTP